MQEGHTPMEERPCFRAGVESLLELFTSLIPHPTHKSKRNRFMGEVGGKGIKPHKADQRESMPWNFLWMVEQGRSAPIGAAPHPPHTYNHCNPHLTPHTSSCVAGFGGVQGTTKPAHQDVEDWILLHSFRFTGARLMEDGHLPKI